MFYGKCDEQGIYIGFYKKGVHKNIPEPNIELSQEQWQEAIEGNFKVVDGVHKKYKESGPTDEVLEDIIRKDRNTLLEKSDWTQFPDSPLSGKKVIEWSEYRQQLRDMMNDVDITNPSFPSKPT